MIYCISVCIIVLMITDTVSRYNIHLAPFILMLMLTVLMSGVTEIPDIGVYRLVFERGYENVELFYKIISNLFYDNGFSYEQFRLIYSLTGFLLIYLAIKRIVPDSTRIWVLCLYLLYPFIEDVPQARNFLAMSLLTYGTVILSQENKWSSIKYIILLLIATGFHSISIVYLPLVLIKYIIDDKKRIKYFYIITIIIFFIVVVFSPIIEIVIEKMVHLDFNIAKKILVYNSNRARYGFILFWSIQIINILLTKISFNLVSSSEYYIDKLNDNYNSYKYVRLIYYINIFMLLCFPLLKIQITFFRIVRNLFILNAMSYAIAIKVPVRSKKARRLKYVLFFLVNIFYVLLFTWQVVSYKDWAGQIISSNWLLPF